MNAPGLQKRLWSIILAGGEGERLRPLVQRWMGRPTPKQYCTFIGTRSMFQHTVDRADQVAHPDRRVTVISCSHPGEAFSQLAGRTTGKVILQPANRETAVGIYLALSVVHAQDPEATVVIYPSDHFVYPEDRFVKVVRSLTKAAQRLPNRLCLLGVSPDGVEPDYGWIQPGPLLASVEGHRIRTVDAFLEKPAAEECRSAVTSGSLWNTLVLAARLKTLWEMGWHCFPEMMTLLDQYRKVIGTSREQAVLEAIFSVMPSRNFSSHLLQTMASQIAVVELKGVLWSDWGRPERILTTLQQIGKEPVFLRATASV